MTDVMSDFFKDLNNMLDPKNSGMDFLSDERIEKIKQNQRDRDERIKARIQARRLANDIICLAGQMPKHDYLNLPDRTRDQLDQLNLMAIEYMNLHA